MLSARLRIQQYIGDLTKVQADVAQENARHTQTMLTLAKLEAARWALTGELLDQYGVIYDPQVWLRNPNLPLGGLLPKQDLRDDDTTEDWTSADPDRPDRHHPMIETWRIRLFPDENLAYSSERNAFDKLNGNFHGSQKTALKETHVLDGNPQALKKVTDDQNLTNHPFISRDDSVVASIRKLADTVRKFHYSDQQPNDPLGWNLTRANVRLQNAVSLIDGTMLLLSANEHSARDDANRLQNELSLHSLRLDSFERRTYEAGFRLTLGDINAFHSTGFTDKDLQILEAAALTAIGIRVGN